MLSADRRKYFDPNRKVRILLSMENQFNGVVTRVCNWELELIRLQLLDGVKPAELILPAAPVRQLVDALTHLLMTAYSAAVKQARWDLLIGKVLERGIVIPFAQTPPQTGDEFLPTVGLEWYQTYALRIAGVQQSDLLDRAKQEITNGIRAGSRQRDIEAALAQVFNGLARYRLANIARTETAKIYEQAHYQEWQGNDDISGYEVCAIMDGRTSEICLHRNGKVIPKDRIEGWWPPYHFSCRTTVVPVFAWETPEWSVLDGPKPIAGFGTTRMEIPAVRGQQAQRLIRTVS